MRSSFGLLFVLTCLCGCATKPAATVWQVQPVAEGEDRVFARAACALQKVFPRQYHATQRAIITVRGRQFVCDGFLTVSPAEGWHLAVVSTLGLVADVRVRADGSSEVVKVTPLFREDWSRQYVARELRWLFVPPPALRPVGRLSDGRLVLAGADHADNVQARYLCSRDGTRWEELELLAGARRVWHARLGGYRPCAGFEREVPTDIELEAGTHELHLRIVAVSVTGESTTGAAR